MRLRPSGKAVVSLVSHVSLPSGGDEGGARRGASSTTVTHSPRHINQKPAASKPQHFLSCDDVETAKDVNSHAS